MTAHEKSHQKGVRAYTASSRTAIADRLAATPFVPAWWLPGGHLQTAWGPLCRQNPRNPMRKEIWTTPDDDELNVYFRDGASGRPIVLLLHGLEGSVQSKYVQGLVRSFSRLAWTTVVMEYRTCDGVMNRAQRMYHAGETSDLAFVMENTLRRFPGSALFLCGISLGGNISAKWLGEQGDTVPPALLGAAMISAPYDLARCAEHIDSVRDGVYARWFLKSLIPKAIAKAERVPGVMDVEKIRNARTFWEYDTYATAALHGFESAEDYWARSSCGQFLPSIRVPSMFVSAEDDPFTPGALIPKREMEQLPFLYPQITAHGGHVGFVSGAAPFTARYWVEHQVPAFFDALAQLNGA
ncbi:MAG: alpha/beta hydrolase [Candidatus Hydrogenedentota bacterium]